ncbi:MAG TPA: plastocyanin/azurin family copper-binding protein [Nitrosopumilus sp.]|nr:plastocyanin/azurin family copper-binding protein [Thermoproteota archaeon]HJJ23315.1 plastocyanin/azurin family copper-binding protein [Nitrosopumilus sp.]
MGNNTILILVSIMVFFAGFGVASVVYYNPSNAPLLGHGMTGLMTSPEDMNQMMEDPNFRNQWMNFMIQDTEHMKQWMQDDPQHVSLMIEKMKVDHDFMMGMTMMMLEDPGLRLQMIGHMTENPEAMQQMMNMIDGNMMMGSGMISQQMQGQNESTQTETTSSYVKMVDGVQVVTINAKEFKFTPSELNISAGKTKFVLINDGVAEHELAVYDASKQDIIYKAELVEDEETIEKNVLFEIEEVYGGEFGESEVMDLTEGSYVIACHVSGHYDAGMKGTLIIS